MQDLTLVGPANVSTPASGRSSTTKSLALATICVVALLTAAYSIFVHDGALYSRISSTESRYWTASKYLRSIGQVRQLAYERALQEPVEQRSRVESMLTASLAVAHADAHALASPTGLTDFYEAIEEYRSARPLITSLDQDLDQLVIAAAANREGLMQLRARVNAVDIAVAPLASRLRELDQEDLTVSLAALKRSVRLQYVATSIIIVAMLLIVIGLRISLAKAREGQRTTQLALDAAQQATREIQKTLQTRTALLGMVSHELRTPLSKVLAATELIEIVAGGETVIKATTELYAAAETMTQQLNDLAVYAELTNARSRARTAELDVRSALAEIIRGEDGIAAKHNVKVDLVVEENVPAKLPIDAIRVGQIAKNLINNAVKYTRDGAVSVHVLHASGPPAELVLVVSDNGQGIAASEQALVWEPFYRAETAKEPGSGLGLAVVKLAVDKLGGRAMLDSAPGKGARFTIKLPLLV